MSRVEVHKDGWDWFADCREHDDRFWCETWADAYEAALGHVCMYHPPKPCVHEYGYIVGSTNEHKCLTCGKGLPPVFWHEWPHEPPC